VATAVLAGCGDPPAEKASQSATPPAPTTAHTDAAHTDAAHTDAAHTDAAHTDAAHTDASGHHGGHVIDLGTGTIGAFSVKATRDEGQIVAGKDAPIDVTVTPTGDAHAKVSAVRFWIGGESAKGSVKAKAEIENPKEPNRWHTHAEIPSELAADSKLWVEIEDDHGATAKGSFDLKR
jgi:hypothetical protein